MLSLGIAIVKVSIGISESFSVIHFQINELAYFLHELKIKCMNIFKVRSHLS